MRKPKEMSCDIVYVVEWLENENWKGRGSCCFFTVPAGPNSLVSGKGVNALG